METFESRESRYAQGGASEGRSPANVHPPNELNGAPRREGTPMANHYTTLSVALDWPPEAVATLIEADRLLSDLASDETIDDDAADPELVAVVREAYETSQGGTGCVIVPHGPGAVAHSDESADVSALAELISFAMRRHGIAEPVVIEWAETCSKPRPGEFGGGAAVVTASETRWMTTGEWARGVVAELTSPPPPPPLLAIVIEGGLVQEVVSDAPARTNVGGVLVIDLDVEGATLDELALIPRLDGVILEAFGHRHGEIAVSPYDLAALNASLDEEEPDAPTES